MATKKQKQYGVLVKTDDMPLPLWVEKIDPKADMVLYQLPNTCLLTRTVPACYKSGNKGGGWYQRKMLDYEQGLIYLAKRLNRLSGERRERLLEDIAKERAVQQDVTLAYQKALQLARTAKLKCSFLGSFYMRQGPLYP